MEGSSKGPLSDRRGAILTATQEADAVVHETTYEYTLDGHRASVTLPSGRTLTYSVDFAGRPTAITATPPGGGAAVPVVADVDYLPGGPPTVLKLGPATGRVTESLDHDWQYRCTGQTVTAPGATTHLDLTYGYDPAGNLETVSDTTGARDASYTYDHLGRLTGVTWPDGNRTYTYDPIGNMTNLIADEGLAGQGELLLTYQPNGTGANTPTLTDMASTQGGSPLWSAAVASDDVGNMTTDGASDYTYDLRNHLDTRALDTPSFDNTFSADGRLARTERTDTTSSLDIILDTTGQRLAKLEDGVWRDYVFLGGRLVGYLDGTATEPVLIITDHIGLPIQAIDPTGALVWDATAEPYGQLRGTLDTTHDPGLRYPGQWQDHIEAEADCVGALCVARPVDPGVLLLFVPKCCVGMGLDSPV